MRRTAAVGAALAVLAAPAAALAVIRVPTRVVGANRSAVYEPRTVAARSTLVRVGRRHCAVAAGTPLAALAAYARLEGARIGIRDYGACGRNPRDGAGLYLTAIDGQRARGSDGWVYEVHRRVPGIGAADPRARLRAGQELLWFYCHMGPRGCQRTLRLAFPARVSPGSNLTVTVRGYDDRGHARRIARATVFLSGRSVRTGRDGTAAFEAPARPGRYHLSAQAPGLVPDYGRWVRVR